MFSAVLFAALAGSAVAAPLAQRGQPKGWATDYLEEYDVYHARYVAIDCASKHDTTFFEDCCHPLLATENLIDNRKAYCSPSTSESGSAASYTATATATNSADLDAASAFCNATKSVESVYESVVATATAEVTSITLTTSSIEETSTAAIGNNDWAKKPETTAAPTTSSTPKWTATSTSTAAAKTSAASGPSGDVKTGGHATYFYQGGNPGACGDYSSDSDYVVAIDSNGYWGDYASNNNSPYCGKWVNIKNTANGNTITAKVADVCPTCVSNNSLDLSVGAFSALVNGDMGQGMISIEWSFA